MNGASSLLAPIAKRLAGKVALITGGASGIGESTARLFAEHGAKVIISDVQDELGFSVSQDKSINGAISYVHCDVTSECDVQNAVNTAVSKHGKLDIMFNTAGCTGQNKASILDHEQKDYKTVFDVNVLGSFLGAKHVAKVMIPVKRGTILFTASCVTESHGLASHSYTASKHANPAILNLSGEELVGRIEYEVLGHGCAGSGAKMLMAKQLLRPVCLEGCLVAKMVLAEIHGGMWGRDAPYSRLRWLQC
ncbi:secoisolariciresinol dehydrogenase-like [Juglans regia]|uniref:Secoisolariciresinol dehydrogenase-like n=1 Tax=Juglans regia TaxID=51240 RepID=A0A6P9EGE1_JUGRE|nr:secoisolariciresinol dehydrogenase-like [Juglans regia]